MKKLAPKPHYGVLAEFASAQELVDAAAAATRAGYKKVEGYSPYPIEALEEAIGFHHTKIPLIVLCGGITGGLTGFGMCYYANVISYPLIVGGKPLNSWPAFIPITFELTILFASLTAVISMLLLNGFPMPYHPLFNVERFSHVTRDGFFLCIESEDPKYDGARDFLQSLKPLEVNDVPW